MTDRVGDDGRGGGEPGADAGDEIRGDTGGDIGDSDGRQGLALMLCGDDFDRLHAGFMLAAAALALDRPVLVFATGPGVLALCREAPSLVYAEKNAGLAERGVVSLFVLRDALVAMDATLLVCESGLRRTGCEASDLIGGVRVAGLPTFLDLAAGHQIVTF
ncbi:DsrE family protein [Acetobacter musti]